MNLMELLEPTPSGYRSEKEDNTSIKLSDTRKLRLTLDRINKLRKMNDTRKLEHELKLEKLSTQYKPPAAAGGGLPGM
jgi:hypothetical protein